ncbi:unnamed protein product [Tilletia controversa]|nr:hypothetical protein CF328_g6884 [Tilletia controversa]CAD6917009.1 unnamed protein product [Tilletia controversa]CAD6920356.1 unnamed protein product [Tilletia controversa]CAD6960199.1 unnamed protein product [Tilletia controversa]CAD6976022.1 unnamed protein product [Tilletia controversa]
MATSSLPPPTPSQPSGLASAAQEASPSLSATETTTSPAMDDSTAQRKGTIIVWALHDFDAEAPDEISFKAGDQITVEETDEQYNDNWWLGTTSSGETGLFPSTYTTPDKETMLASRSAFEAVPETEDDPAKSTSLMGNTMAELDNALKQMQHDPRASYAGTFDFDDDDDRDERGGRRGLGDNDLDEEDEDDFLASQSSAARAALALKAKSNALSETERERAETEQRKAAAQRRLEEEEDRQRALLLLHSEESIKNLASAGGHRNGDTNSNTAGLGASTSGLQRKPTLTSRIPLSDVEVSDESDSEAGDHHPRQHQKRTEKGKADVRDEMPQRDTNNDAFTSSLDSELLPADPPRARIASDEISTYQHSILHNSRYESGLPSAFSEVSKLHEAAAAEAAAAAVAAEPTAEATDFNHSAETAESAASHTKVPADDPPSLSNAVKASAFSADVVQSAPTPPVEPNANDASPQVPTSASGGMTPTVSMKETAAHLSPRSTSNVGSPASAPQKEILDAVQTTPKTTPALLPSSPAPSATSLSKVPRSASKSSIAEPGGDPHEWTVEQVAQWGRSKGWDETAIVSKFIEHEITGDVLLEMDVNILREIDILAFGKRFQVATGIKELLKRLEGANNPVAVADVAVANGWTVSPSPIDSGAFASSASSIGGTADGSVSGGCGGGASATSSPFMQTAVMDSRLGSPSPQQLPLQEEVGLALSPPSNEMESVSMFPGFTAVTTSSMAGQAITAPIAIPAPVPSSAPVPKSARVSFSQVVQEVPPPTMGYGPSSSRMRNSLTQPPRGALTNAQAGGGVIGPSWPSHLITVASGQGIGNVYAPGDRRDLRGGPSGRKRESFSGVSTVNYSSLSQSPLVSSALPPGGGTIPPPLLLPRRRESSAELNKGKGSGSGSANGLGDPDSPALNTSPRPPSDNGRPLGSGERTSFFSSLTGRSRKPAPRTSIASGEFGPGAGENSMGSASSGSVSKHAGGGGFSARFKRGDKDRDSAAFSDARLSQTGSMSSASGGPVTQQGGRSSFGSGTTTGGNNGRPASHDVGQMTPSITPLGGVGAHEGGGGGGGGGGSIEPAQPGPASWDGTAEKKVEEADASGVAEAGGRGESVLAKIRPVDLEGWMLKKGERYNMWKPRYLALKGPDLVVLRAPESDKIKGYISMKGYRVLADENTNPGKYGFKLVHEQEKSHHFSSADPAEVRGWMKALMKATIGRDNSFPVISSYNNKTISLREAQSMYPPPRPPSPDSRLRVQRANIRANPNSLSAKDAAILTGLIPKNSGLAG